MTTISRTALGLTDAPQASLLGVVAPAAPTLMAVGEVCFTSPTPYDLCAYRGDSGRFRVTLTEADGTTPVDVSTATWDCDIRKTADDTILAGSMTVELVDDNVVDVILPADLSAQLVDPPYVWDLQMTQGVEVTTLLAGTLTVTPDVSRNL